MRIGLVSYRCKNKDIPFNISQIERALKEAQGKVDLLCFGEAFLQGFDSLCWNYETDLHIAVDLHSETIQLLCSLTVQYDTALLTGYIEKDQNRIYSSCAVIEGGQVVHNYRRISKGWKEYTKTDSHYCEGSVTGEFDLHGQKIMIALCGDLWDYPKRFRTDHLLIWPVYVNYTLEDWNNGVLDDYARQALSAGKDVLMINPIDTDPVSHGGAFRFQNGTVTDRTPFDQESILIVDTE